MKKYILALMLPVLAFFVASCDPSRGDEPDVDGAMTVEQLKQAVKIEQVTEDGQATNEFKYTVQSPMCIVQVLDKNNAIQASGYSGDITILPSGSSEIPLTFRTINHDGSLTEFTETFTVKKWVGVPEFMKYLYGPDMNGSTTWTWDTEATDGVWGNGEWMSGTGPQWWVVTKDQIDGQCTDKGLPNDGIGGWFKLSFEGSKVETSRGETGTLIVSGNKVKDGWDLGTLTFNGTIPLLGVQVNFSNQKQYVYQIVKIDEDHLRLCAQEPQAGTNVAWYWNFKRVK
jgi:hypothetical protein